MRLSTTATAAPARAVGIGARYAQVPVDGVNSRFSERTPKREILLPPITYRRSKPSRVTRAAWYCSDEGGSSPGAPEDHELPSGS